MRASSRIMSVAALLLLAAPAAASPDAPDRARDPQLPFTPVSLHADARAGGEEECAPVGPPRFRFLEWWRQWFASHGQRRDVRDEDMDRTPATPFYLRSPLLSGFIGRGDSAACGGGPGVARTAGPGEECVELNLAPGGDEPVRLQFPLPQLQVTTAKRFGALINEKLQRGETIVLLLPNGQRYPVGPALTGRVEASTCDDGPPEE